VKPSASFSPGDKVGVGCFVNSCRNCNECKNGIEQYCNNVTWTYGGFSENDPGNITQGGYSSSIVVDENYVVTVPDSIFCAKAAPLLCAGITCYSPFKHFGVKAGSKLGVVGLGGLGHMAVKIGVAMGAQVTVISTSANKRETALAMGASDFIVSSDEKDMKRAARSLNFVYDSIASVHKVSPLLDLLACSGTLILVGGVPSPLPDVSQFALLARRLSVVGSCIGGIHETQEMLNFCAEHNITADIELVPATPEAVESAWVRAEQGDVKYRFVLDTKATLTGTSV